MIENIQNMHNLLIDGGETGDGWLAVVHSVPRGKALLDGDHGQMVVELCSSAPSGKVAGGQDDLAGRLLGEGCGFTILRVTASTPPPCPAV